jgi:hypothetical protein
MEPHSPNDANARAMKFVDGHERGIYTLLEAASQVMDCVTNENAAHLLSTLPNAIRDQLITSANSAPSTDEEWAAAEYVHIGSGLPVAGWVPPTEAETKASMEIWKAKYRVQVEAIRECMP